MNIADEERLLEEIGRRIEWYSTALLRLRIDPRDPKDDRFIGSGTLVEIDGRYGLVTAWHVAEQLTGQCDLGIILRSDVQRCVIANGHFAVCKIAPPDETRHEPDLAFIEIYGPDVGTIKAYKTFYNMSFVML